MTSYQLHILTEFNGRDPNTLLHSKLVMTFIKSCEKI